MASKNGHHDVVQTLLAAGADTNSVSDLIVLAIKFMINKVTMVFPFMYVTVLRGSTCIMCVPKFQSL